MMTIQQQLVKLRKDKGLSIYKISKETGLHQSTIKNLETKPNFEYVKLKILLEYYKAELTINLI